MVSPEFKRSDYLTNIPPDFLSSENIEARDLEFNDLFGLGGQNNSPVDVRRIKSVETGDNLIDLQAYVEQIYPSLYNVAFLDGALDPYYLDNFKSKYEDLDLIVLSCCSYGTATIDCHEDHFVSTSYLLSQINTYTPRNRIHSLTPTHAIRLGLS